MRTWEALLVLVAPMVGFAIGCQGILGVEEGTLLASTGGAAGSGGVNGGGASSGGAVSKRSCIGLAATCGPTAMSDCCASSVVPGGTFNRSYDGALYKDKGYPATVSSFELDTYEVTVGRFRKFVEAYPESRPPEGSGRNPNNPKDPGWDITWSIATSTQYGFDHLPRTASDLRFTLRCDATWTDSPGANESRAMTCLNWYVAFAFCIWDGGRLPTEAEWNYAAAGGDEQRIYPWGDAAPDETRAVYCSTGGGGAGSLPPPGGAGGLLPFPDASAAGGPGLGAPPTCVCSHPEQVGAKSPTGDGRWGQADLAGNAHEWTLDEYFDPYAQVECVNCANLAAAGSRVHRGGSCEDDARALMSSYREPLTFTDIMGVRCARSAP